MLFNSPEFLFMFLPGALIVFFLLGWLGRNRAALGWLVVCSFFFYGWWNPRYLVLIDVPDGDIFFLKSPPSENTLPTILLHSPPF